MGYDTSFIFVYTIPVFASYRMVHAKVPLENQQVVSNVDSGENLQVGANFYRCHFYALFRFTRSYCIQYTSREPTSAATTGEIYYW